MPLTAVVLEARLLNQISPGNTEKFYELLTEAEERLLNAGKWAWTRTPLALSPSSGYISLPSGYESIVGARIGDYASAVKWQEIEYLMDGPGLIPVQGCSSVIVDNGIDDREGIEVLYRTTDEGPPSAGDPVADEDQLLRYGDELPFYWYQMLGGEWQPILASEAGEIIGSAHIRQRRFKVTGNPAPETVSVLARFAPRTYTHADHSATMLCPLFSALKYAMMAIVYENANDIERSVAYMQMATKALDDQERSYRGTAKEIFKPKMFMPIPWRGRTNAP